MKKHIAFITGLLLCTPLLSAQNAADILAKAAAICKQPGGLTASFTMQTRSKQMSESFEGVIQIKGDKFALSTPDVKTWYDGLTQWTYMEHTRDVTITTPEGEDLQFTNPAILLGSYQKNFTATYQGEIAPEGVKARYSILLTPRNRSGIEKITLEIEKPSNLPLRIAVQLKNHTSNIIHISDIKTNVNLPDRLFSFPAAGYPDAEIIDLR
jgi:outer membrane lipoprotein-sorting protein